MDILKYKHDILSVTDTYIVSLTSNIITVQPKVIMTGDERVQGEMTYSLKDNIDVALKKSGHDVKRVFVASRTGKEVPMTLGRDVSLEKVNISASQETTQFVIVFCPIYGVVRSTKKTT